MLELCIFICINKVSLMLKVDHQSFFLGVATCLNGLLCLSHGLDLVVGSASKLTSLLNGKFTIFHAVLGDLHDVH